MTDTIHIMLDLETWGTEPGCDLRSIGACVFNPLTGQVADNALTYGVNHDPDGITDGSFYVATDNPVMQIAGYDDGSGTGTRRKYPLIRDPRTVQWWSEQSDEAQAAFADPVDLRDAVERFGTWIAGITRDARYSEEPTVANNQWTGLRIWSHGAATDGSWLAAVCRALGLPLPWHYRAPRDTRTAFDMAGIDDEGGSYRTFLTAFATGTYHHALHDAIAQARAVCAAYAKAGIADHPGAMESEADGFMLEAAMHHGFEMLNGDGTIYRADEAAILKLTKAVRDGSPPPQPIDTCPKDGALFNALWIDADGKIERRVIDCHCEGGAVKLKHGYPAVWTVFKPQPTHWAARPINMKETDE